MQGQLSGFKLLESAYSYFIWYNKYLSLLGFQQLIVCVLPENLLMNSATFFHAGETRIFLTSMPSYRFLKTIKYKLKIDKIFHIKIYH